MGLFRGTAQFHIKDTTSRILEAERAMHHSHKGKVQNYQKEEMRRGWKRKTTDDRTSRPSKIIHLELNRASDAEITTKDLSNIRLPSASMRTFCFAVRNMKLDVS